MIPKIIHFCWLSGDEYPKLNKKCIESWQKKLPDYELVLWDTKKFDINLTTWTKQAFEAKQYAFAADYIRFHVLYNYGGIYLDSDVEVLKTFDNLLDLPYFMGVQCDDGIEAAVIGAEKGVDWIKNCLEYYDDRSFIKEEGNYDQDVLPFIMRFQIEKHKKLVQFKPNDVDGIERIIEDKNSLFLFPNEYFSPKNHQTRQVIVTKNTYCIHHYNHSWFNLLSVIRLEVIKIFGLKTTEKIIELFNLRKLILKFKKRF